MSALNSISSRSLRVKARATAPRLLLRFRRSDLLRDRRIQIGGTMLLVVFLVALLAPVLEPYSPTQLGGAITQGPSWAHPMGTDPFGRDQLSRVLAGSRISVSISLIVVTVALVIGLPLGLLSGYARGRLDFIAGRALDVLFAFPSLLLALVLTAMFGPGLHTATAALCVIYIAPVTRFVRGLVIVERDRPYVTAARISGATPASIMIRQILPNISSPLLVISSFIMSGAVLLEAALSYLGFGVQPPGASWGRMLTDNSGYLTTKPYLILFPGLSIMFLVFALTLLGDGFRDHLDPRQRQIGLSYDQN